jgi:transcriptional regulator with XRE-family HTH domain
MPGKNPISEQIRAFRKRNNLSQQDLASLLQVGIATVKRWEYGETQPKGRLRTRVQHLLRQRSAALQERLDRDALVDSGEEVIPGRPDVPTVIRRILRHSREGTTLYGLAQRLLVGLDRKDLPPFPASDEEHAAAQRVLISGEVDRVLAERFEQEMTTRGLTASKMLETILWHHYGRPSLSFEGQRESSPSPLEENEDRKEIISIRG